MKTWKPDTCECTIEEIYNGTEIVGGGQVVRKCSAHADVPDNELYGVLYSNPDGENKRKNLIHKHLLEDHKGLLSEDVEQEDGQIIAKMKKGIEYKWSFTGSGKNRVLDVEVKGVSLQKSKKDEIKAHAESLFGVGKTNIK